MSFCWGTGGDPFTDLGIKNLFGYSNLGGEKFTLTLKNGGQVIVVNDPLLQQAFIGDTVQKIIDGKIKTE